MCCINIKQGVVGVMDVTRPGVPTAGFDATGFVGCGFYATGFTIPDVTTESVVVIIDCFTTGCTSSITC